MLMSWGYHHAPTISRDMEGSISKAWVRCKTAHQNGGGGGGTGTCVCVKTLQYASYYLVLVYPPLVFTVRIQPGRWIYTRDIT